MKRLSLLLPILLASSGFAACASEPTGSEGDVCQQAVDLVDLCLHKQTDYPAEGCVDTYKDTAEEIVEAGCEGLRSEHSDGTCTGLLSFFGVCDVEDLSDVAEIPSADDVCPSSRSDELCNAIRAAHSLAVDASTGEGSQQEAQMAFATAIGEARDLMSFDASSARTDPAYRYLLRERSLSLLVHNVLTNMGSSTTPSDYQEQAQDVISKHYPAYADGYFPLATLNLAPATAQHCTSPQGLMIYPGVVRLTNRDEFDEQAAAIESALPCFHVERVETGSFVVPSINADQGSIAAANLRAEFGDIPLHMLGYSQGASNVLATLVEKEDIKTRVQTVMVMNSAAHGSEVADVGAAALTPLVNGTRDLCRGLPEFAKPLCDFANLSPIPSDIVLNLIANGMAVPRATIDAFIAAEDNVEDAPDVRLFFERHTPGIASLSTDVAQTFWQDHGHELPRTALYYSFRSVISDTSANLPDSNLLFHALLERAGGDRPYNDMQVRIDNQSLEGPIADLEIIGPIAEGNHWQWELATGAVGENVMPAEMTDKIPHRELLVGHYQAIVEFGAAK